MKFSCEHCGRQLSVADGQAGKKGRCPQCKSTVTVPLSLVKDATAQTSPAAGTASATKSVLCDPRLFDVPPADVAKAPLSDEEAYEKLRAMHGVGVIGEPEEPPKRPLPWLIDIFLYPLNKPGMVVLMLCIGVPLLLRIVANICCVACIVFPPMLVFWVLFIVIHWTSFLLFLLYINWYVAECIRDSAAGGIRAADTIASTPGLGELFGQSFTVLACGLVCMAPALFCTARGLGGTALFWVLYGLGGFLFPMALLAVIMSESLLALNPIRLLGAVLHTLVPYCALVAFSYVLCLLLPVAFWYVLKAWTVGYPLLLLATYQLLVLGHLLGRFYYRNQEKLNWDA